MRPVLLVDGRSGSGKTELARLILERDPAYQVLRLDDLYPGWSGLDAASAALPGILENAHSGRWRAWNWQADVPGDWRELDPERPVLVEGVGALTRASRPLAAFAVWVELDADRRRARALARDPYFAEHWDAWAAQEDRLLAREHPRALADLVVDASHVADALASVPSLEL